MEIKLFRSVDEASQARGVTVVIDVFRAFSTQVYLFENGAAQIIPVLTLDEAYALKAAHPEYVLLGERGGLKPEGFDFGNSPTEVAAVDFTGKTIIHTTSNGTKGLMNAIHADELLTGSFVNADAIVKYIQQKNPEHVSLIATSPDSAVDNEDVQLALHIERRLRGESLDIEHIRALLRTTSAYRHLFTELGVPETDFDLCLDFNRAPFVIRGAAHEGRVVLTQYLP
jgi:2-phosphosulfolactate phosphatase